MRLHAGSLVLEHEVVTDRRAPNLNSDRREAHDWGLGESLRCPAWTFEAARFQADFDD